MKYYPTGWRFRAKHRLTLHPRKIGVNTFAAQRRKQEEDGGNEKRATAGKRIKRQTMAVRLPWAFKENPAKSVESASNDSSE